MVTSMRECPATVKLPGQPARSRCDVPTDAFLCTEHVDVLVSFIVETVWIVPELETALSRQTNFGLSGGRVKGDGSEGPLLHNEAVSKALSNYKAVLEGWQAKVADSLSQPVRWPGAIPSAAFLHRERAHLMTYKSGPEMLDAIAHARGWALSSMDRPPERHYLGECGWVVSSEKTCAEVLWGVDDNEVAECKTCGAEWPFDWRLRQIRDQALEGMEDRLMTATQAAATIVAHAAFEHETNEVRLKDRIRKWAAQPTDPTRRPRLTKRVDLVTMGQRRRPGYRLGDIMDILRKDAERRARTAGKRADRS